MSAPRAFVLGGGVAGIAAAFALRDLGREVALLEAHRWLGGRAFSRRDDLLGAEVDNGPHVVLGCYARFRTLLRRLGTEGRFVRQGALALRYREPGGRTSELRLPRLPPRLGLGLAALGFGSLALGERLRFLRGAAAALAGGSDAETLEQWLARRGQHGGPRRFLWDPLCRAVMNGPPAAVSARLFLATLVQALSSGASGAAIWFPAGGWGEVLGGPARDRLERAGIAVRLATRVVGLARAGGKLHAVELAGAPAVELGPDDIVVSALPWHELARLLGADAPAPLAALRGAPITTVHFAGLALADEGPLVCLVDGQPFHFVCRRPGAGAGSVALLASGAFPGDAAHGEAERQARAQVARYYPGADAGAGVARVIRIPDATALLAPEHARGRLAPGRHPVLENLWICGDATGTGVPSTLEGAAISAEAVVAAIAASGRGGA